MKANKYFNVRPQYYANITLRSQGFTYPTAATPPRNAGGTVVDSDIANHAKSHETSISF
jgi:hypothetical protein